jgi:hypothetical protein
VLLQAWFITAIALPAPSTTTVRTINKGVFIATSLRLPPTHADRPNLIEVQMNLR